MKVVQAYNPRTKQWVKIDRSKGKILAVKKTEGKFKGVPVYVREEKSTYKYYKVPNEQLWAIQECNSTFIDGYGSSCIVIGNKKSEQQAKEFVEHLTKLQYKKGKK